MIIAWTSLPSFLPCSNPRQSAIWFNFLNFTYVNIIPFPLSRFIFFLHAYSDPMISRVLYLSVIFSRVCFSIHAFIIAFFCSFFSQLFFTLSPSFVGSSVSFSVHASSLSPSFVCSLVSFSVHAASLSPSFVASSDSFTIYYRLLRIL